MSDDRHEPFRALLAERMDGPLAVADAARLEAHLAGCPACRSVARDYEADRERMRAIRAPQPPRDLWARTSAALDREIADDADALLGASPGAGRSRRQLRLAVGSLVAALTILAITGGQLMPGAPVGLATATPFAIPAQAVSYVGLADGELTFYRADVAEVCPPRRLDCADGPDGQAVVRLGSDVAARQMAMSQTGQLFISGSDDLGEEVFAIVTLPSPAPAGPEASASPGSSPDASMTADPESTPRPTATRNPDLGQADPPTPAPTDGPDILPSPAADSADASASPSISPPPSPTTAIAPSQSILTDVIATGAAAAWSPDGTTLAFSAMPADHKHGSDVYVWRPGDKQAHAITDDHASLFASWSGSRIVVSRVADDGAGTGDLTVQTLVIDPESGEGRAVDIERAWLPTVDPTERFVIYWRGRLVDRGGVASPEDGRLYVADWTELDPWPARKPAEGASEHARPAPASVATTAGADPADPSAAPDAEASEAAPPSDAGRPASSEPAADPANGAAGDVPPVDAAPTGAGAPNAAAGPGETVTPSTSSGRLADAHPFVLERPRAVSGRTRDWVVRWSADGNAYAVWTAETGSKVRGSLVVHSAPSVDAPTGVTLLDRVLAGRSFGLGDQRIAWVAPLADGNGDLWLSVWGERGQGSVKLRRLDSMDAVPAY